MPFGVYRVQHTKKREGMKRNWRREMPNIQFKTHPISATAHRGMVGIFITANYYYPPIGRSADYCRCLPRASTHQNHNLRSQRALLPSSARPPPTGTQRVRRYLQRGHHFEVRGMECSMIVYNKRRQKNVRIGKRSQRGSNFIPIQYLQRETFDLPSPQTTRVVVVAIQLDIPKDNIVAGASSTPSR